MDNGKIIASLIGRTHQQVDCWQLVREFYMKVFGVELRSYYDLNRPTPQETQKFVDASIQDFERVEGDPKFGDIMLIQVGGFESHIAVFVGEGRLLHSTRTTGSVLDRVEKWKPRIVGYYRHKAKAV